MMDIGKTVSAPCKDCKDRWFNPDTLERCHGSCNKYKDYKDKLEQNRQRYTEEVTARRCREDSFDKWSSRVNMIKHEKAKKTKYKTM